VQVFDAFHTQIHRYQVEGVAHVANAQDPQIPVALSGVVDGVVSLRMISQYMSIKTPDGFACATAFGPKPLLLGRSHSLSVPSDFAAIYISIRFTRGPRWELSLNRDRAREGNINLSDVSAFRYFPDCRQTPSVIVREPIPALLRRPGRVDT